jgi:hypothetical protein
MGLVHPTAPLHLSESPPGPIGSRRGRVTCAPAGLALAGGVSVCARSTQSIRAVVARRPQFGGPVASLSKNGLVIGVSTWPLTVPPGLLAPTSRAHADPQRLDRVGGKVSGRRREPILSCRERQHTPLGARGEGLIPWRSGELAWFNSGWVRVTLCSSKYRAVHGVTCPIKEGCAVSVCRPPRLRCYLLVNQAKN